MELCAGGLPAAHFRVSGRSFARKDPDKAMTFDESQQLKILPPVADYDRGREDAEREWEWERWQGALEVREAMIVRSSDPVHRWSLDQLAVARSGGRLRIGYVTRVAFDAPADLALTLRLWTGAPKAMRPAPIRQRVGAAPVPSLILADARRQSEPVLPPQALIPAAFTVGRCGVERFGWFGSATGINLSVLKERADSCAVGHGLIHAQVLDANLQRVRRPICTPTTRSTGIRGARRHSRLRAAKAKRSCCRSGIRRAIGAT
jgi:hypothetical protein